MKKKLKDLKQGKSAYILRCIHEYKPSIVIAKRVMVDECCFFFFTDNFFILTPSKDTVYDNTKHHQSNIYIDNEITTIFPSRRKLLRFVKLNNLDLIERTGV